jgi:signal transduction histidine kinase
MDKISNNSVIGLIIPKKVFFKEFVEPSLKILFSFPADLRVFDSKNAVVAEYKDFPGKAEKTFSYNLTGPFEDYKLEISANPSFIMLPSSFGIILAIIFFALIVLLPLAVIFYFYWHGRKTEDELSLKSNWILNLAHSIQGPVHSLKLLCEVFNENQSKKVSDLIFSELDSLDKKNRKFMKLASAGLVVEPVKIEEIKIGDLVKKQVENFSKQLKILDSKHKIELDVKVNSVIKTDIGKLEEVIEELLANALKFSPGQELIKVIVEKAAGDICIKILDNGLGISDAEQKKLFDPFYRVENSHNEGILGTGLGLFLAKKTIESCGGRLVLSSNGHKKGTSVSILLPENKT